MGFQKFPADEQEFMVRVALEANTPTLIRDYVIFGPVRAQLDASLTNPQKEHDVISGWDIVSAEAEEAAFEELDFWGMAGDEVGSLPVQVVEISRPMD